MKKKSINLIVGCSGSGKSSLAYDTIAQIGKYEMDSMFANEEFEPQYKVSGYKNMLATIPIEQINNNSNIRSTIGTYFGINRRAALIYSVKLGLEQDFFTLNKEENLCPHCLGIGFVRELDVNLIVDYNIPLERCPIKCWTRNKDFYTQIICKFCTEKGIDSKKNFRELSSEERTAILYGESSEKYSIKYKRAGVISTRTTKYYGVMTTNPMISKFIPAKQFLSDHTCFLCNGKKYSPEHDKNKFHDLSIGEFMCTPFKELIKWIEQISSSINDMNLSFSVDHIRCFIEKAVELDLGHLFFNRAIPTLSGGELQRLRLVQVFVTQLSDLLVILDEPLAGLSYSDKISVHNNIVKLAEQHTLIIVDHSKSFLSDAKTVIALGEKSGKNGGYLINPNVYWESQIFNSDYSPSPVENTVSIKLHTTIYKYKGIELEIAENRLNIITGKSGVGKSILLHKYLPQFFDRYTYISQKALGGKNNSSVASSLGLLSLIVSDYAKYFKKENNFFSKLAGGKGACSTCCGLGYKEYGNDFQIKTKLLCKDCNGSGFKKSLDKYKITEKSIIDIWFMTIDEAYDFYCQLNPQIAKILNEAIEIMLGHLQIGQSSSTLSGGENIRIKILKSLKSSTLVYGVDEPFRGLGKIEIIAVIKFLGKLVDNDKTIIVAEHEQESFHFFSKKVLITNESNKLIGVEFDEDSLK